jgi:hypothetical protein
MGRQNNAEIPMDDYPRPSATNLRNGEPVETYSGHEYAVRPVAVHWQGARLEIEAILNAWRDPQGKGFRVRTAGGQVFDLFYDFARDAWQILETG